MEEPLKLFKQYLKDKSDEELRSIYLLELSREARLLDLSLHVYEWLAEDWQRFEWGLLNEIAKRWVNNES